MEFHPQSPAQQLCARLLPDGRVSHHDGRAFPAPTSWRISRCWWHGGQERCLLKASVLHRAYFADVLAAQLTDIERGDGVVVRLERFARR